MIKRRKRSYLISSIRRRKKRRIFSSTRFYDDEDKTEKGDHYLCQHCGNIEEFKIESILEKKYTKEFILENLTLEKKEAKEEVDEEEEVSKNITCLQCGKSDDDYTIMRDISLREAYRYKWKHTSKTGRWYQQEVSLKNRNEELEKYVMVHEL